MTKTDFFVVFFLNFINFFNVEKIMPRLGDDCYRIGVQIKYENKVEELHTR